MKNNRNTYLNINVEKVILQNGLEVILEPIEVFSSSAAGFFLKKGSRDEQANQGGFYHFCEHMLFKGTEKLSKDLIAEKFDEMGGYINAYTSHEQISLYNRMPSYYLIENLQIMYDMLQNSQFTGEEVDLERQVIINEINSTLEDPAEKLQEDFFMNLFHHHSLGLPIIGTKESINGVSRETLYQFYLENFYSDDLIFSAAGNFDRKELLDLLNTFEFRRSDKRGLKRAAASGGKTFFTQLPSEQLHVMTGNASFDLTLEEYVQMGLLNIVLGESMSSRLFQRVREELGLCYTIYSYIQKFREEHAFVIYMSIMPKNMKKAFNAVSDVINLLLEKGITQEELDKTKNQKIGNLLLSHDNLYKRMSSNAQFHIKFNQEFDKNRAIEIINKTTLEDIEKLIKKVFVKDQFITQALYKDRLKIAEWKF